MYSSVDRLTERFAVDEVHTEPLGERYNIAPTTPVYAIRQAEGTRRLGTLRWGFVAPWADRSRRRPEPINARLETAADSRLFGPSVASRRCLLPADGFYEWHRPEGSAPKQPYLLAPDDGAPIAFAGIWSSWRDRGDPDATPLYSTAILTTEAQGEITAIHHRMPVILPPALWEPWLTAEPDEIDHVLTEVRSLPAPGLTATPISTRVNNARNDDPGLLEPLVE